MGGRGSVLGGGAAAVVLIGRSGAADAQPVPVRLCAKEQRVDLDHLRAEPEIWPLNDRGVPGAADLEVQLQTAGNGAYYWCTIDHTGDEYRIVSSYSD